MGRGILCVSLFLIALLSVPGFAQSPPDLPNFRAGTTLIEFTVVATDQDGRHVVDLKPEEVSIVDGGHPRDSRSSTTRARRQRLFGCGRNRCPRASTPIARNTRRDHRGTSSRSSSTR